MNDNEVAGDRPDTVLFEILNEPAPEFTHESWEEYWRSALAIIRQSNPNRTVIIGPPFWNSIDQVEKLVLPEQDRNLIVTVHYYQPMAFTHQGAAWAGFGDKTRVEWKGTDEEMAK